MFFDYNTIGRLTRIDLSAAVQARGSTGMHPMRHNIIIEIADSLTKSGNYRCILRIPWPVASAIFNPEFDDVFGFLRVAEL
jgi:hypothetical protein